MLSGCRSAAGANVALSYAEKLWGLCKASKSQPVAGASWRHFQGEEQFTSAWAAEGHGHSQRPNPKPTAKRLAVKITKVQVR